MKRLVRRLSEDELRKYPISDIVEGWFFQIVEITPGVYRVEGIDHWGRKVSRVGMSPEELLEKCKKDIQEMIR